ncbi:HEPN domain-containing protein [Brevibacillus nitrificans]|uniref:HEPN domain-containing protein n=1 Tax=Brevibacillus nitrificans TaxID=651560 RepID=UPI0026141854|nr:HEPN domain-containing protein [Brevibacillus nitrificans]MED1791740.1 HEPN domain-containing protein [Brevibacillus nitrificans]
MPRLIAPVFNSTTPQSVRIDMPNSFTLISGAEKPYQVASRYLRNEMDENRRMFDKRVDMSSLFLVGDYPEMRLSDDRDWIEEIENKLNLATTSGTCSIPYVITAQANLYGITYLKRSLDGSKYMFDEDAQRIFLALLERNLPTLAFRRYSLSLEKKSYEDQLLDLWIGLESLFVPDGKKGEITYKLRLRMAYYFGETLKQREKIAQLIKKSYNHRSEIVHSGKVFGNSLAEEVGILRLMARAAILNVAMEGITLQDLRVRLDQLILTGDSYYAHYQPSFFERVSL